MARIPQLALIGMAALVAGCSGLGPGLGPMPDLPPGKVMTKDEQQSKVDAMIEKAQQHERDAAKQIEQEK
jgi:hypothetical protein